MDELIIAKEPKVEVRFRLSSSCITQISLSLSKEGFTCLFEGDSSPTLRAAITDFLTCYAAKSPSRAPDVHLTLSPFYISALSALREVPFGSLITYGELAARAGSPQAARAAGTACRLNPYPLLIPCHRVVGAGSMGGFAFDARIKERLIQFEKED